MQMKCWPNISSVKYNPSNNERTHTNIWTILNDRHSENQLNAQTPTNIYVVYYYGAVGQTNVESADWN